MQSSLTRAPACSSVNNLLNNKGHSYATIVELLQNSKQYNPPVCYTKNFDRTNLVSSSSNLKCKPAPQFSLELAGTTRMPSFSLLQTQFPNIPHSITHKSYTVSDAESHFKDPNNASKCREYRVRSRARKEQEIQDYQVQLARNMKLRAAYDKKTETIKRLKAYYVQCLKKQKYKCKRQSSLTTDCMSTTLSTNTSISMHASGRKTKDDCYFQETK